MVLELAVVVPVYNECANVRSLIAAVDAALTNIEYEIIYVDDDSADGTADLVRAIGRTNRRIRCIQRVNRRGLASACIEGMMSTAAPYIAVIDGDMQHDERILPAMLDKLRREQLDIVIGSRNIEGGSMGEFARERVAISGFGKKLSRLVSGADMSDPMSGFFLVDRMYLDEVVGDVSAIGFKILLDLVSSARRPVRIGEVPYHFRNRTLGISKLDVLVLVEYIELIVNKLFKGAIPPRFVLFSAVGLIGATVAVLTLVVTYRFSHWSFPLAQAASVFAAMTSNFFLNNIITYRDRRLRGLVNLLRGLMTFYMACAIGAFFAVQIAELLRLTGTRWFFAAIVGLVISAIWNFEVTRLFTWRLTRGRARKHAMQAAETV